MNGIFCTHFYGNIFNGPNLNRRKVNRIVPGLATLSLVQPVLVSLPEPECIRLSGLPDEGDLGKTGPRIQRRKAINNRRSDRPLNPIHEDRGKKIISFIYSG